MVTVDNAIIKLVRRLEVFTGAGRRRTWSAEDKARIVAEIVASGASVSAVDGTDLHRSNYLAGGGNCKLPRLRLSILKSFSLFRPFWTRHRPLRRSAINAERRGTRLSPVKE